MEKYVVSSCLAGIPCRYDCGNKKNDYVCKLVSEGRAIPLCPEQLGGLPTPREAAECKVENGEIHVYSKTGVDLTNYFYKGANIVLNFMKEHNITKAILQKNSPSCGVITYDGTFTNTLGTTPGVTAKILMDNDIEIISSQDLGGIYEN